MKRFILLINLSLLWLGNLLGQDNNFASSNEQLVFVVYNMANQISDYPDLFSEKERAILRQVIVEVDTLSEIGKVASNTKTIEGRPKVVLSGKGLFRLLNFKAATFIGDEIHPGFSKIGRFYAENYTLFADIPAHEFFELTDEEGIILQSPQAYERVYMSFAKSVVFSYLHELAHIFRKDYNKARKALQKINSAPNEKKKEKWVTAYRSIETQADFYAYDKMIEMLGDSVELRDFIDPIKMLAIGETHLQNVMDDKHQATEYDRIISLLWQEFFEYDCFGENSKWCDFLKSRISFYEELLHATTHLNEVALTPGANVSINDMDQLQSIYYINNRIKDIDLRATPNFYLDQIALYEQLIEKVGNTEGEQENLIKEYAYFMIGKTQELIFEDYPAAINSFQQCKYLSKPETQLYYNRLMARLDL